MLFRSCFMRFLSLSPDWGNAKSAGHGCLMKPTRVRTRRPVTRVSMPKFRLPDAAESMRRNTRFGNKIGKMCPLHLERTGQTTGPFCVSCAFRGRSDFKLPVKDAQRWPQRAQTAQRTDGSACVEPAECGPWLLHAGAISPCRIAHCTRSAVELAPNRFMI